MAEVVASVWLLTCSDISRRATTVISRASSAAGAPPFTPHVTLLGGVRFPSERKAIDLVSDVVDGSDASSEGGIASESFFWNANVTTACAASTDYLWNKCCFLRCVPTSNAISKARQHAAHSLGVHAPDNEYDPHLSLAYGVYDAERLRAIESAANESLSEQCLLNQTVSISAIALWRCEPESAEGVQHWRELKRWSLGVDGV